MESGYRSKDEETIKIKFKAQGRSKNKTVTYQGLNYAKFAEKLKTVFQIEHDKYYRLYYLDIAKEDVFVENEEDYAVFIQNTDPMIFYLEQTEDEQHDFRSYLQKSELQSMEIFNLKKLLQKKCEEIKTLKSKLQGASNAYSKVDSHANRKKSKLEEIMTSLQQQKSKMKEDLKKFRKDLNEKTENTIKQRVQELKQEMQDFTKRRTGTYQHYFGCQNPQQCKYDKSIIGLRYRCLLCQVDFCQSCANLELHQQQKFTHKSTHPMVRFKNGEWDDKVIQLKDSKFKSISEQMRQKEVRSKTEALVQTVKISEAKARSLALKLPSLTKDELAKVVLQFKTALLS